jgi:hypothetical protein
LFVVLSSFALYLVLLGAAALPPRKDVDLLGNLALAMAAGLLTNYWLVLTQQRFGLVLIEGLALAALGAVRIARGAGISGACRQLLLTGPLVSLVSLSVLLVGYYFLILSEPLTMWDARSVWFFHARALWLAGALRSAGWTDPSLAFSSPDYPKLVPALAAQLGHIRGFWNEFFPKGSLVLLLLPALLWTFSLRQRSASFVVLVITFFLGHYEWLSNGAMDAYLVVYSGLALVFVGRYTSTWHGHDLLSALCALGLVMALKNEGLLFGLCLGAATSGVLATRPAFRWSPLMQRLRHTRGLLAAGLVSFGPMATWNLYKFTWGLQNQLTKDPGDASARTLTRLVDGSSIPYVLHYLLVKANSLWAPLIVFCGLLLVTRLLLRRAVPPGATISLIAALLHFGGMVVVYLSTPATLEFHLFTSAARTMASTRMALLVGIYFLLANLERPPSEVLGPASAARQPGAADSAA